MAHEQVTCEIKDGFAVCHVCGAKKKELRGIPDCVVQPLEGPFCEGEGSGWIATIKPEYLPKPVPRTEEIYWRLVHERTDEEVLEEIARGNATFDAWHS